MHSIEIGSHWKFTDHQYVNPAFRRVIITYNGIYIAGRGIKTHQFLHPAFTKNGKKYYAGETAIFDENIGVYVVPVILKAKSIKDLEALYD